MALVVVQARSAIPGRSGRSGWIRFSVWIYDFSSSASRHYDAFRTFSNAMTPGQNAFTSRPAISSQTSPSVMLSTTYT